MLAGFGVDVLLTAEKIVEVKSIILLALSELETMRADVSMDEFLEVVHLHHFE